MGWQRSSLNRILRNETYVGTTYYNKSYGIEPTRTVPSIKYRRVQKSSRRYRPKEEWMPIQVAPIITRDLFERAQEQLNRNVQFSPRKTKYQYLLRGLTRCGLCGALYAGIPCHGKRQYRCRNKDLRFPLPKNCKARMISAHIVEPLVSPPDGLWALWAVLGGLAGAVGVGALYRGLAIGAMGIVAPITSASPLIPLTVGLARGERPSAIQLAGIGLALSGVALAGWEPGGTSLTWKQRHQSYYLFKTQKVGFALTRHSSGKGWRALLSKRDSSFFDR